MLIRSAFITSALFASITLTLFISPLLYYRGTRQKNQDHHPGDGATTRPVQLAFDRRLRLYVYALLLSGLFGSIINVSVAVLLEIQPATSALDNQQLLPIALKVSAAVRSRHLP